MRKGLWPLLAAAAVLAAGCGGERTSGEWNANINSIYIAKDGTVKSALAYTSEQFNELYDQDGLAAFVSQAVADYVAENGETVVDGTPKAPVIMEACTLEGRSGTVVFSYASPEDFVKFSQATGDDTHTVTSLSVGTVRELAAETAYRTPSGKDASYEDVCKKQNAVAVRLDGSATVCTGGKILYVSPGVTIDDEFRAQTPEAPDSCIIFKK